LEAAEKASSFISRNLTQSGRLLASYRQGPSEVQGFIDDYAFFQAAQLDLYESTFNVPYLKEAVQLEKDMARLFWDEKSGGFYFTGNDQKDRHRLLTRNKETYDGVIPSGNSMAALNYFRLAEFTGQKEYRDKADAILKTFSGLLAKSPSNFPKMLQAFQFDYYGPSEIFVVGPRRDSEKILRRLWNAYLPNRVLVYADDSQTKDLTAIIPWVEGRSSQGGKPTVYVCRNYHCQLPTTDEKKVLELVSGK
jgi:uncharacterized protein YyaL (SSP411 family)